MVLAPAAALLLTACSGDGEVRQFVTDFAMAVSTGDRATMEKMYPDAALAEALSIEANADSMQVEKADDGTYTVSLGYARFVRYDYFCSEERIHYHFNNKH